MEADTARRYQSRIIREMNANRKNPFNSPPSSTGSRSGSPTRSSIMSDPEGESTRKLREDMARVMNGASKLSLNYEAAHRKWPEHYSMPKSRSMPVLDDDTDTRPLSSDSKENKPPGAAKRTFSYGNDLDDTQNTWEGSVRTRAEMQPRVDNESDLSSILSKPPARGLSSYSKKGRSNPSPLAKVQTRSFSSNSPPNKAKSSLNEALDQLRRTSLSPKGDQRHEASPNMSSAKSSLTAVARSPQQPAAPAHNASQIQSFIAGDVSHLDDLVTGTLRFDGNKNGVPMFVKNGRLTTQRHQISDTHYPVASVAVPQQEEDIFISLDDIRKEIANLQTDYDKMQEYATSLEQKVQTLESDNKQAYSKYQSSSDAEKERAMRKLQDACEDINKLNERISTKEKEVVTLREEKMTLREDNEYLRQSETALHSEKSALHVENDSLRQQIQNLREEKQSHQDEDDGLSSKMAVLREEKMTLREENETLRRELTSLRREKLTLGEENNELRDEIAAIREEKESLRSDNDSLVRNNEKYFNDNKILRRENSGFERSIADLHEENLKLKEEIELLKQQLDHCRPIPKEDFSARLDEETEENMTSAFFVPDITMENQGYDEYTHTKDVPILPEFTEHNHNTRLSTIPDVTEEQTRASTKNMNNMHARKSSSHQRSRSTSKAASAGNAKVAFQVPDPSIRVNKSSTTVANQGSKRRTSSHASRMSQGTVQKTSLPAQEFTTDAEDTTGFMSQGNPQDQYVPTPYPMRSRKETRSEQTKKRARSRDMTMESQKSQRARSQSRASHRRDATVNTTVGSSKGTEQETCPALSADARRVLDVLCDHNCSNCMVCSRISSHGGVVSQADVASGKKRVTVPRPVPVTDRELAGDHTMRPARSPGVALAMVAKGLEDEAHHMQMELTRLQAQYNEKDKSLGRRDRLTLVESIRTLLKKLEAKNDQIYNLYDVLEGQKAAGQEMTEEEMEITVMNITGMTVREVTGHTDITWEGVPSEM